MSYVFDTNAFNRFLDDDVVEEISNVEIFATHIQLREIEATKDSSRRQQLLSTFDEISDEMIQTESMVFPIVFGQSKFGDDTYKNLRNALDNEVSELSGKSQRKKKKGHPNDAQIAEVALKRQCILVTDDPQLLAVFPKFGGSVKTYDEFKKHIKSKGTGHANA